MLQQTDIELTSIDPSRRRARRYRLTTFRALFGSPTLLISWGRIGQPPRVRIETFTSEDELEARRAELLVRRHAHGYVADGAGLVGRRGYELLSG